MVMVQPGSDGFMTVLNKASALLDFNSDYGVTAIQHKPDGYKLALVDATRHDARYLRIVKTEEVTGIAKIAEVVKKFAEHAELDSVPLFLKKDEEDKLQWVLVDPTDLRPQRVQGKIIESSFPLM